MLAVQLIDAVLKEALSLRASDLHIEPQREGVRVRYRVDGVLMQRKSLIPLSVYQEFAARIKLLAGMDTSERRRPQDGHLNYPYEGRSVDLRVASVPYVGGEGLVIRIMRTDSQLLSLEALGFSAENLEKFHDIILKKEGMVLVVGPMNSGKTTTLYAALSACNCAETNITTVEDPIEYSLEGINQIQVNPRADLTFATALRGMLRMDADRMMIGEIRDEETAGLAVRAALTGHAVYSSLHTKDTVTAVFRMMDLGAPPYLLAATLSAVLAQRLVRRICPHCKREVERSEQGGRTWRGTGCAYCNGTGYFGRIALHELLILDDDMREYIMHGAGGMRALREMTENAGMRTLFMDGMEKVAQGLTTMEEVEGAFHES